MPDKEYTKGVYFAIASFVMWGLVPIYFKAVDHVSALEVISHRVVWSCVFLGLVVLISAGGKQIISIFKQPKLLLGLSLSALVISINWLVFIWAVAQERVVETTLGYFINPLINIVFAMFIFGERLRLLQWVAVVLAGIGVGYQLLLLGELPWIAITLAVSFSLYSVLRKKIPVDAISGLFIETLWLLPMALIYMFWLYQAGSLQFVTEDSSTFWLLISAGLVTSLPLLAFAAGARRISLTLTGLIQYIGPSIAFMIAVFHFGEPMDTQRLVTFIFIWAGLIVFSVEGIHRQRHLKKMSEEL